MSYTNIVIIHIFKINIDIHQYYHITLKWVQMTYKYDPIVYRFEAVSVILYTESTWLRQVEVDGGSWRQVEVFSETKFRILRFTGSQSLSSN